ncbi:MAG TPA: Gfo/Idh/MocA family oxidoreductase [Verrucomicrobiae bacterium]|nr:Gfo/Idh/MocA family oxidoreductase [Verrucomicrobiae bacterium]
MSKLRWGVLGVAKIATAKVIPSMQAGELTEITAIASRDRSKAEAAARELGIPRAYGSYEELLRDPEIDAIYNPLPNHLHVPWSIRAADAGKHVLCEKPIAMSVPETRELIAARDRTGVTIGEAFMVQVHPQWERAVELARGGQIGTLRAVTGNFGYFNPDPRNIRNVPEYGGGGLMDIGCYPIKTSRMIFGEEPRRVAGVMVRDPAMGTDMLTSAVLEYPSGQCVFTCSTQMVPSQSLQVFGTTGRIQFEIPFNAVPGRVARIWIDDGSDITGANRRIEEFAPCDQYTLQGDRFSQAVLKHTAPPVPLEDSLANMAVIEAIVRASASGRWEEPRYE